MLGLRSCASASDTGARTHDETHSRPARRAAHAPAGASALGHGGRAHWWNRSVGRCHPAWPAPGPSGPAPAPPTAATLESRCLQAQALGAAWAERVHGWLPHGCQTPERTAPRCCQAPERMCPLACLTLSRSLPACLTHYRASSASAGVPFLCL